MASEKIFLYISSWNLFGAKSGLGLYSFDAETGNIKFLGMQDDQLSCNVTYVDRKRNLLYVNNEVEHLPFTNCQGGGGRVCVYKIEPQTGTLTPFCESPSYGSDPCMLSQDSTGHFLVVANHGGRNCVTKIRKDIFGKYRIYIERDDAGVVLFPLDEEGRIGDPLDIIIETDPRPGLAGSHPHSTAMSPSGDLCAVCDNGWDRIRIFKIDRDYGKLVATSGLYEDAAGSNDRFSLFHNTLPYLYVNHEVGSLDVTAFKYDKEDGHLTYIQSVSAVDDNYEKKPRDEGQGLVLHPSGKYLYDAVAGPEEIAVFEISQDTGALTRIQNQKVEGIWLRSCSLSPDGNFLVTTCLKTGDIAVFRVGNDGKLTPTGAKAVQAGAAWSTFYKP